ncbi:hypothetical protein NUW58_g4890 [Xylaria curta]|uniref:Uncharacterized protein n=1 Tax=Xylaria curta TaxID=42375 RepID=A0ACC1P5I1_9PEZI|nr:hypothetical protein NUW58_g4890 [Xylaria curta]
MATPYVAYPASDLGVPRYRLLQLASRLLFKPVTFSLSQMADRLGTVKNAEGTDRVSFRALALNCLLYLNDIVATEDDAVAWLRERIEDERGRFRIWASNLGALHNENSAKSLEFRLRNSERMHQSVTDGLKRLEDLTYRIYRIVSGILPNRIAKFPAGDDERLDTSECQVGTYLAPCWLTSFQLDLPRQALLADGYRLTYPVLYCSAKTLSMSNPCALPSSPIIFIFIIIPATTPRLPQPSVPTGFIALHSIAQAASRHLLSVASPCTVSLGRRFGVCFGDKGDVEDITEADIISTVEFDHTGNYLATGDKGGRVVLFERNETKKTCEYKFHTEFQSHEPEFDYLKSLEIEEKINKIKWCRRQNASHYLLSTNDKTIKLWKVFEKSLKVPAPVAEPPVRLPQMRFKTPMELKLPRLTHHDTVVAAVPRRTYANAHAYHINSISVNSDGETFISSDDLRINLWNLNIQDQSFNIVDIKPANMEELTEVITAAEFHPVSCNWFMYASSKGTIKLADMRESALCDQHAKLFEQEEDPASRSFFSEIISSISDVRFSHDGRYILSRDYLTVKIWDVNMERQPVKTIPIHEHLRPRLCDTYENDSIFDKFEVVFSGDAKNVMTGSYNNNFMIYPSDPEKETEVVLQADKSAFKAKKVGIPTPINSSTSSPAAGAGQGQRMRKETDADQIDFNKKILHMSWHPFEDSIAIAATNNGSGIWRLQEVWLLRCRSAVETTFYTYLTISRTGLPPLLPERYFALYALTLIRRHAPCAESHAVARNGAVTPKVINAGPSLEKAELYGIHDQRSTHSKLMGLAGRIFIETIPQWLTVGAMLALIFGGCCSNVFALEAIVKVEPASGTLLTFVQFLFVAVTGYVSQFDATRPPFFIRPNRVPIRRWLINIVLFFSINLLNNHAFSYDISVPVHIILRSGGSITTIVAGSLYGKRYSRIQVTAVVLLTIGQSGSESSHELSAPSFSTGLGILFVAQALSAVMGLYTEETYKQYGPQWKENLFYSHILSLPLFLPFTKSLVRQFMRLVDSPPLVLRLPIDQASLMTLPEGWQKAAEGIYIPSQVTYLALNVLTQYACIRGVNLLAAVSSALTVTIVLNIRKLVSLLLSIWLFGNRLATGTLVGAVVVFSAGALYSLDSKQKEKKPTASTRPKADSGRVGQAIEHDDSADEDDEDEEEADNGHSLHRAESVGVRASADEPSPALEDGMLLRDMLRKTTFYDPVAERQNSQTDAKLFYQMGKRDLVKNDAGSWSHSHPTPHCSPPTLPKRRRRSQYPRAASYQAESSVSTVGCSKLHFSTYPRLA